MSCRYCGKRISLLRKLKDSEFCSEKHRDRYHQEQTELALARLTESGKRINQPRRSAEPVEAIETKQLAATSREDPNLPEPSGFISEPPAQSPPNRPHLSSMEAEWLSVTAIPPLFEVAEAKCIWEPLGYCRPALAARTGAENPRPGGGVTQAEFEPAKLQLPVTALALDLSQPVRQEVQEHYAVAPPVPIPMRSPARPEEAPPCSPVGIVLEAWPPAVVSNLEFSPVKLNSASLRAVQLRAAPPCAGWAVPPLRPAEPCVSLPPLLDGPFQRSGETRIPAEPGWRNRVPSFAAYTPQTLSARSIDARALEAAGAVAGTPPRRLPVSAGPPDAELRLALCRLPKQGAVTGTIGVFGTGMALAAREPDPVRLPGFLAPAIAVGMPSLGGYVSMPPAAAQPLDISTQAAGEIPLAVTRRLPELDWSAATSRSRAEAAWGAYIPQPHSACSMDARALEAVGSVAGTPLPRLPASVGLPDAEPRLALCRLAKPGAAAGTIGVLGTGMALAASERDQVRVPGFLAPAMAVGMRSLGGRASMPLAAVEPLEISTGAAAEIPPAVTRRLPKVAWSAVTPQLRAQGALSAFVLAMHSLPPRSIAGANRVTPVASRAKGGRKVAVRMSLPTAHLPLPGPRLSHGESQMPLAAPPPTAGAEAALVAPLPEVCTFIPSRRRPELKARIAMPGVEGVVRCRGMATSVKLQRLGAHLASVEDPRLAAGGAARFMDWTGFPPPAMPSPQAIFGPGGLTVTLASVRPLTKLFAINLSNLTTVVGPVKPAGATPPHTICRPPRMPSFGTAKDGSQAHARTSALLSAMVERLEGGPTRWALTRLWRRAPVSLKGVVAGIVLLGVLTAIGSRSSGIPWSGQWNGLREDIRSRAAVDLVDDFRAGMGAWDGAENWAETWSYDNAGFVQTGKLALYRPSMTLNNYRFEFLGQIAKRGMGWVFRAVDTRNYYAMKVVFTNSGPAPAAAIVRYAVIDGKPGPKTQLPLPMEARTDRMCRIRVDVDGPNFTAQFQDQVVDVWSDQRLAAGGVGFFSDKGEQAKIRWIEVTHQSDFLGKLCAYLVPYDAHSANRSLTR